MTFKRRTAASRAAAVMVAFGMVRVVAQQPIDLPPRETAPGEICGTGPDRLRQLGLRASSPARDGEGISFRQDPPLLLSDYTGTVALRDFLVAGDVPTMRFKPANEGSDIETWSRIGTRQLGGRWSACSSRRGRAARSIAR